MNSLPAEMTPEMQQALMENAKMLAKSLSDGTLDGMLGKQADDGSYTDGNGMEIDSPEFWLSFYRNLFVYYSSNEGARATAKLCLQADRAGFVSQNNMVRWWGLIIEMNDENPKLAAYKNRMREFAALAGKYVTSSAEHFSAYSRLLILMGVRLNRNYNTEEEAASLMRIVCEFYESDANAAIKKEVMEYKGDMYLPFYAFHRWMTWLNDFMPYSSLTQVYYPNWGGLAKNTGAFNTRPTVMFQHRRLCAICGVQYDINKFIASAGEDYFSKNDDGQQMMLIYKQIEGRLRQPQSKNAAIAIRRAAQGDTSPGMIYTKQIMFFYHAYEEVKMNPNSSWKNVLENPQQLGELQMASRFLGAAIYARTSLYTWLGIQASGVGTAEGWIGFMNWMMFSFSLPKYAAMKQYLVNKSQNDSSPNQIASNLDFWQQLLNGFAQGNGGFHRIGSPLADMTPVGILSGFAAHAGDENLQKKLVEFRKFFEMPDADPNADTEAWYANMRERYETFKTARLSNM